jgi:hypothetical protein
MPRKLTLPQVGDVFGRWRVVAICEPYYSGKQIRRHVICDCDCGTKGVSIRADGLARSGSCGCLQRETATKHGLWQHPLYAKWRAMHLRCGDPRDKRYADYGGRGIAVCDRWKDLTAFVEDMEPSYSKGLELDRIDTDGGYEPDNCRWATHTEQARNKRSNIQITHDGRKMTVAEWCVVYGMSYGTVWERIKILGWDPVKAITTPALDASERCARARAARTWGR